MSNNADRTPGYGSWYTVVNWKLTMPAVACPYLDSGICIVIDRKCTFNNCPVKVENSLEEISCDLK